MKSYSHFVFLFCFFFIGCASTMNKVSYSFIDSGNYTDTDTLGLPRLNFINYDNYIFEFVLQKNVVEDITVGEKNTTITNTTIDTIGLLIHNLNSKTYTKIWPFDTTFKIIEKNKPISEKKEGFVASFGENKNNKSSQIPKLKPKVIDGLKLKYFELADSAYQGQVYLVNKTHFRSPYELYIDMTKHKYCMIGYKINFKKSSDIFGELIANIKPIDDHTNTMCRLIINKLRS